MAIVEDGIMEGVRFEDELSMGREMDRERGAAQANVKDELKI